MMHEEEDEETLFDQEGLLGSGRKSQWDWEWLKRFTKTVALALAFFALGLCISIPGATLLDLEERTHTTTESISLIFTARSVGYLMGSIVGGVLFDYFDQQILLFYTLILTGVATIAVPWCTALLILACMIAVQGLALGVLDTGGNMFCIKIWNKSSAPYMQALHFSFAIGAFLAPLLARPFLVGESALGPNSSLYSVSHVPVNTNFLSLSRGHSNPDRETRSTKEDVWWWQETEAARARALRDIRNNTLADNEAEFDSLDASVNTIVAAPNSTGFNNTSVVSVLTTTVPRNPKPAVADGIHLKDKYANGNEAEKHLKLHKDDEIFNTDNLEDVGTSKETTTEIVALSNNDTSSVLLSNSSVSNNSDLSHSEGSVSVVAVKDGTDNDSQSRSSSITHDGTESSKSLSQPSLITVVDNSTTTPVIFTTTTTTTTTTPKPTTNARSFISTTTQKPATSSSRTTSSKTAKPTVLTQVTTAVLINSSTDSNATITSTTYPTTTVTARPTKPKILDVITSTIDAMKHMSKIQFAYMIIGLVLLGNAVLFLGLYWKDCRAGTLLHQVTALGPSPPLTSSCFRASILSLLFVFFLFYVGVEVAFGGLITTFAVESDLIRWSRPQGATLAALFWGSIAVGRGMAIFISRCFKPPCMLVTNLVFMLTGAFILSFGLPASAALLWVGTVILGIGMSSIFPTAVSWADCYYPLTGRAAAIFITGSGVGEMVIPVVTGYLFEKFDSLCLMYVVLIFSGLVSVVFICLQCVASHHPPIPTSASKLGFMPLHNDDEENSMALEEMANGSTGYTDSMRRRPLPDSRIEDAEEETTKLVDLSD